MHAVYRWHPARAVPAALAAGWCLRYNASNRGLDGAVLVWAGVGDAP